MKVACCGAIQRSGQSLLCTVTLDLSTELALNFKALEVRRCSRMQAGGSVPAGSFGALTKIVDCTRHGTSNTQQPSAINASQLSETGHRIADRLAELSDDQAAQAQGFIRSNIGITGMVRQTLLQQSCTSYSTP